MGARVPLKEQTSRAWAIVASSTRIRIRVSAAAVFTVGLRSASTISVALALIAPSVAAQGTNSAAARSDYILYCAGCHGMEGAPLKLGRIPALRNSIGDFLNVEGGRAYLVQVPGVNNTGLNDERIARVINWVLGEFSNQAKNAGYKPYTAIEVAKYRADRPVDISAKRRELIEQLAKQGLVKE